MTGLYIAALTMTGEVPGLLSYQGRLIINNTVFDGPGAFKFGLLNADGSQTFWLSAPDINLDKQPDAAVALSLERGLYSVLLGDTNLPNMAALPTDVFTNPAVYLRVWFDDGTNGFQVLSPDQRVATVGYAMMAATVPDGAITAAKLAGSLEPAQIPNLDASKITSGNFGPRQLPANVAYTDTHLVVLSNALVNQFNAGLAGLNARIQALETRLDTLVLSNSLGTSSPPGLVLASSVSQEPAIIANGFAYFTTIAAPAWVNGTSASALSARYGHTAVWTGIQMAIWGGYLAPGTYSSAGSLYHPGLDEWQSISPISAPSGRSGHSAVWTGQAMIVWGGFSPSGYLNSGAYFRPDTQTWTPLPEIDAPTSRDGHCAVWTGKYLVIWGGKNSGGVKDDGALYNLAANQWTALNLTGQPSARYNATAIWTGDRMLVWGGSGASGVLDTGGQLLFDANGEPTEWRTINATGTPSARTSHSAVWTGQTMIVWGGRNGGLFLDNGAIYDPVSDSWTAIAPNSTVPGRSGHCGLWLGNEMVVLGGENNSGALASGAAYDPASSQWRNLTTAGNPQPRNQATAVWTGTELLVFGGRAQGQAMGALQRLDPQPTWYLYRKQ